MKTLFNHLQYSDTHITDKSGKRMIAQLLCRPKFYSVGITMMIIGTALLTSGLMTNLALAQTQTDLGIGAKSPGLNAEFEKDLDKWLLRAKEGNRDAQFKVGVLFAKSQLGLSGHKQSAYWYTQSARQGHVLAQFYLGRQFLSGTGVKRDEKAAMQWWLKAAEQHHALAQFNVARGYLLGIGFEKDLSQAKHWFQLASQNDEPKSTEILKQQGWWNSDSFSKPKHSGKTGSKARDTAANNVSTPVMQASNNASVENATTDTKTPPKESETEKKQEISDSEKLEISTSLTPTWTTITGYSNKTRHTIRYNLPV